LIRERWKDFPESKRVIIEERIVAGPPREWFQSDADRHIDRTRFDVLGEMERLGLPLGGAAKSALTEIQNNHPEWMLRPSEEAGFHIWHGGADFIVGNPEKLQAIPAESLIDQAKMLADNAGFMDGDDWQALCQSHPQHALEGLEATAKADEWPVWAWKPFLRATEKLESPDSVVVVAKLLLRVPDEQFSKIADDAAWWLNEKAKGLADDLLWPLWDRVVVFVSQEPAAPWAHDAFSAALGSPSGHLAEILIRRISKGEHGEEMPDAMRQRFDALASSPGIFGELARIRFAADVSLLFEKAPDWTIERLLPLFDWKDPEASNVWSARKYSNYIGSPNYSI